MAFVTLDARSLAYRVELRLLSKDWNREWDKDSNWDRQLKNC